MKLGLKKRYPDLKLAGNVSISKTVFGSHNYIENATVNNSIMGDFSYVGSQSYINRCTIGKFTCIGPNVKIGLGSHPASEFISVHPVFYSTAAQVGVTFADKDYFQEYEDTHIGNDVWIGANAIVKSGVNVGDGAIIASGAVVTKDVAAYSVVGGIPSKLIKYRFEADEIKKLVDLKWWDHDSKWLKENYRLFHSIRNLNNLEW
jgi:acetyltransferase-like isoleucine patch superfamily enzyme